ncbi:MAG: DUF2147 domain-containing protein [Pseudomonadota bacterium]
MRVILFVVLSFWPVSAAFAAGLEVEGLWVPEGGDSLVRIADCGDGTPCGTVAKLDPSVDATTDVNNPDPALRDTPLLGLKMLWGFKPAKDRWRAGRIYDPGGGKTYRSAIKRLSADQLEVKGCIGPICRTQYWSAAPEVAEN